MCLFLFPAAGRHLPAFTSKTFNEHSFRHFAVKFRAAIDDQAATRVVRKESATVGDAAAGQKNAGDSRSEKRPQQPWIGHRDIDGLHGGNALSWWKGGQGLHDENR